MVGEIHNDFLQMGIGVFLKNELVSFVGGGVFFKETRRERKWLMKPELHTLG
jgi:hypothetical protein